MNKIRTLLFSMFILFLSCAIASAFTHVSSVTISAGVYFVNIDTTPPSLIHSRVKQFSYNSLSALTGTVIDPGSVEAVELYYWSDTEMTRSTQTFSVTSTVSGNKILSGTTNYHFSFDVSAYINENTPQLFYYIIAAWDSKGNYIALTESNEPVLAPRAAVLSNNRLTVNFAYAPGQFNQVQVGSRATIKMGPSGGVITLEDGNNKDGETSLTIPAGALSRDVDITITEIHPNDRSIANGNSPALSERPLSVYRFSPAGLIFDKMVKMSLLYPDVNQDGLIDGTQYAEFASTIMWWDGFEWRYMGGTNDTDLNLVYQNIKHFSIYAVFPAGSLKDSDYRPKERIITPALVDDKNDYATFGGLQAGDVVNIYDVTGHRIVQLNNTNIWNGKDEDGDIVESGIYIYQIKTENKLISGTIVVAK